MSRPGVAYSAFSRWVGPPTDLARPLEGPRGKE